VTASREAVIRQASELVYRPGALYERHPWLEAEMGVIRDVDLNLPGA
jgi:hypothetical protein